MKIYYWYYGDYVVPHIGIKSVFSNYIFRTLIIVQARNYIRFTPANGMQKYKETAMLHSAFAHLTEQLPS